jgi:hypothetical protein
MTCWALSVVLDVFRRDVSKTRSSPVDETNERIWLGTRPPSHVVTKIDLVSETLCLGELKTINTVHNNRCVFISVQAYLLLLGWWRVANNANKPVYYDKLCNRSSFCWIVYLIFLLHTLLSLYTCLYILWSLSFSLEDMERRKYELKERNFTCYLYMAATGGLKLGFMPSICDPSERSSWTVVLRGLLVTTV